MQLTSNNSERAMPYAKGLSILLTVLREAAKSTSKRIYCPSVLMAHGFDPEELISFTQWKAHRHFANNNPTLMPRFLSRNPERFKQPRQCQTIESSTSFLNRNRPSYTNLPHGSRRSVSKISPNCPIPPSRRYRCRTRTSQSAVKV